ncbi:MAG: ABC transporter permease [Chitinophagaceae bacterium]|mgnify:CR=1 FL=1|nr:ABC transporter permease [Chitinophagaceae bacterium]MBP8244637.1 ABC transporter permease [Chitinophagaceae bacterium]
MKTLIYTEWLKMRKYNAFWWIMGITALAYPGINFIFYSIYDQIIKSPGRAGEIAKLALGNPFSFPEAWHTVAYFSSWFVFMPAVVVIMFVSNEYSFKTHRQNIIDGWSRDQFIGSKLIDVALITLIITLLYSVISLVTGILNEERLIKTTWDQAYYIGLFALQTFSQLSIAFLCGFLLRKAFIALGVFLFYFIVLEPVLVAILRVKGNDMGRYLPIEISDRLIPVPAFLAELDKDGYRKSLAAIPQFVLLTLILTTVIWGLCFWLNRKRDLK